MAEADGGRMQLVSIKEPTPSDPTLLKHVGLQRRRGVGANTALRDAALLCRALTAARDGRVPLIEAIHDYEARMIAYGFDAVLKSRDQMDGAALIHKPVVGRAVLAGMRASMRLVNHLPPLKQRMADALQRSRGADRD